MQWTNAFRKAMKPDQNKMFVVPLDSVERVTHFVFRLAFRAPNLAPRLRAGQFVNISVPRCGEILWRRPFSIHRIDEHKGTFSILFDVVGRGTSALKEIRVGEKVNMLGPLGNFFDCPQSVDEVILVAGGLGIAPFYRFLQQLNTRKIRKTLFYGCASSEHFCCLREFENLDATLYLSTDDGSEGESGLVTEPLRRYLERANLNQNIYLYACGPTAMLRELKKISRRFDIPAFVSVENTMACGFGACMGCAVPLDSAGERRYALACTDGPVFALNEILLDG